MSQKAKTYSKFKKLFLLYIDFFVKIMETSATLKMANLSQFSYTYLLKHTNTCNRYNPHHGCETEDFYLTQKGCIWINV